MPTPASLHPATEQAASLQHNLIGIPPCNFIQGTPAHPGTRWFDGAGLGLFIHWGISSVHGATDLSWGMIKDTPWNPGSEISRDITPLDYYALADHFDPQNYHPQRWLAAAKAADATYAVTSFIVTKIRAVIERLL
jgi:alpha-L-fucosidase